MKKLLMGIAVAIVCMVGGSACSSDKTDDGTQSDGSAKFLTFGFYQADNSTLDADYVAEISSEMLIRLPADVDKTTLVARFTTSENDLVYVGSTAQVSGTTANDFSYPVDYVVSDADAKLSSRYTVKIGKILTKVWSQVSAYNDTDATSGAALVNVEFAMTISPKDQVPYFFISRTNSSDVAAGVVAKLENGTMSAGAELSYASDGTTSVAAKNAAIAVDAEGKIYAMYYYSTEKKMFVKTGSGASWSIVGAPFGNTTCGSYYAMGIEPVTKQPIVAFYANSASGSIAKRNLNVCYYTNSAWSTENQISDISGKTIYSVFTKTINGALYLGGTVQGTSGTYFVFKYNSGSWETVVNALPVGVSQPNIVGFTFDIASDGTVYVCCGGDEDAIGTWKQTVYKVSNATTLTRVATPLNTITTSSKYALALYNDLPAVFYKNPDTDLPTIVMLNAETKQWEDPITLGTTTMSTKDIQFGFDANGVGYAAFLDSSDQKALNIYKYAMDTDDTVE